jgi:hypothetical protein
MVIIRKSTIILVMLLVFHLSSNVFGAGIYDHFEKSATVIFNSNMQINTKEIIKVKNIEFTGDMRNKLLSECVPTNSTEKCTFDKNGKIDLHGFKYGNLNNSPAAYINEKGELLAIRILERDAPSSINEIKALLTEKYGKPTVITDGLFTDKCYTRHFRQQAYWKDANGTVIQLDNIMFSMLDNTPMIRGYFCVNGGELIIMSKQFLENVVSSIREDMKAEENRKKKNLNNL